MSAAYSAATEQAFTELPASIRMYSYCRPSRRSSSSMAPRIRSARPVEVVGSGEDLEARLVLHHELAQELAIEPVQVVDRVDDAVARPHAEEQRDLAQPGLEVDDDGRSLGDARQLDAAVHGDGRGAGAALGAEEHEGRGRRLCARRRLAARGRPAQRAVKRVLGGRPGEELVGARPHGLKDQVGFGHPRHGEDGGTGQAGAQALDRAHRRRRVAAGIDDDNVRRHALAQLIQHADGNRARSQQAAQVLLELFVLGDKEADDLCHGDATALSARMLTVSSRARPVSSSLRRRASPAPSAAFSWSSLSSAACFFSASSRRRSSSPCLAACACAALAAGILDALALASASCCSRSCFWAFATSLLLGVGHRPAHRRRRLVRRLRRVAVDHGPGVGVQRRHRGRGIARRGVLVGAGAPGLPSRPARWAPSRSRPGS